MIVEKQSSGLFEAQQDVDHIHTLNVQQQSSKLYSMTSSQGFITSYMISLIDNIFSYNSKNSFFLDRQFLQNHEDHYAAQF